LLRGSLRGPSRSLARQSEILPTHARFSLYLGRQHGHPLSHSGFKNDIVNSEQWLIRYPLLYDSIRNAEIPDNMNQMADTSVLENRMPSRTSTISWTS
jgi:hypothetical protein